LGIDFALILRFIGGMVEPPMILLHFSMLRNDVVIHCTRKASLQLHTPISASLVHDFWDQIAPPARDSIAPIPYHLAVPDYAYPTIAPSDRPPARPPRRPFPPNCSPPPPGCNWQDQAIPCNGIVQDFDYVRLNTGTLVLCCDPSAIVPPNGGCEPLRYACNNGTCYPRADGIYNTLAECNAALIPPEFMGGQDNVLYRIRYSFIETQRDGCDGAVIRVTRREVLANSLYQGAITGITGNSTDCNFWDRNVDTLLSSIRIIHNNTQSGGQGAITLQDVTVNISQSATGFLSNFRIVGIIRADGQPDKNLPSRCPI